MVRGTVWDDMIYHPYEQRTVKAPWFVGSLVLLLMQLQGHPSMSPTKTPSSTEIPWVWFIEFQFLLALTQLVPLGCVGFTTFVSCQNFNPNFLFGFIWLESMILFLVFFWSVYIIL